MAKYLRIIRAVNSLIYMGADRIAKGRPLPKVQAQQLSPSTLAVLHAHRMKTLLRVLTRWTAAILYRSLRLTVPYRKLPLSSATTGRVSRRPQGVSFGERDIPRLNPMLDKKTSNKQGASFVALIYLQALYGD